MELIATQPGFKYVDEPLHPQNLLLSGLVDSSDDSAWDFLIPGSGRNESLDKYFEDIEKSRIHIGEPKFRSRFFRFYTNRIVYKILRCKDLIPWFQSRFGWKILYLVRHPLACSVSRKQFPRLALFLANESYLNEFLSPMQVELAMRIVKEQNNFQLAVLDWCIQNLPALRYARQGLCEAFFYESLLVSPAVEIKRLAHTCDLEDPARMLANLKNASASTVQSDQQTQNVFSGEDYNLSSSYLLAKWRRQISVGEESRAFDLLRQFGVYLYEEGNDLPVESAVCEAFNSNVAGSLGKDQHCR